MGSTGDFFLHFDPPATAAQLDEVRAALHEFDYDCPTRDVVEHGTQCGQFGEKNRDGNTYAYWRKPPMDATNDKLVEIMEAAGLNGHGYLTKRYHGDGWTPPPDRDRFAFGECPEMLARIERDQRLWDLWLAACRAHTRMEQAARAGDDEAMVVAALEWREGLAAHDAAKAKSGANTYSSKETS